MIQKEILFLKSNSFLDSRSTKATRKTKSAKRVKSKYYETEEEDQEEEIEQEAPINKEDMTEEELAAYEERQVVLASCEEELVQNGKLIGAFHETGNRLTRILNEHFVTNKRAFDFWASKTIGMSISKLNQLMRAVCCINNQHRLISGISSINNTLIRNQNMNPFVFRFSVFLKVPLPLYTRRCCF